MEMSRPRLSPRGSCPTTGIDLYRSPAGTYVPAGKHIKIEELNVQEQSPYSSHSAESLTLIAFVARLRCGLTAAEFHFELTK